MLVIVAIVILSKVCTGELAFRHTGIELFTFLNQFLWNLLVVVTGSSARFAVRDKEALAIL